MPKLDDFDNSAVTTPLSQSAQTSISNKYASAPAGFGTGFPSSIDNSSIPAAGIPQATLQSNQNCTSALQDGGTTVIDADRGFSNFINTRWRPMMAVIYMITCTTDFVVFPVLWSILQAVSHGSVTSQWQPLTLQGAGLYHIAMGAVLGLAAYGRSQEKIAGKD
jgi:hypothetical protein